jgi:hypothetical protein
MFGPTVSPYEEADHAFWLLSSASTWLPQNIHSVLLEGMRGWVSWAWHDVRFDGKKERWASCGELWNELHNAVEKRRNFKWTERAKDDALNRISWAVQKLGLTDAPDEIFTRFMEHQFPHQFVIQERGLRSRRTAATRPLRRKNPAPKH